MRKAEAHFLEDSGNTSWRLLVPRDHVCLTVITMAAVYVVSCCCYRCKMELIKPAVDWRKAGVKVNTMGAAVAAKA